jgi:hypothetical protein
MRALIILALPALLGGCWTGPVFYAQSESQPAIPAGKYKVVDIVDPFRDKPDPDFGKSVRVAYSKDGQASIYDASEAGDDSAHVVFAPLPGTPDIYVVQATMLPDLVSPKGQVVHASAVYGLVNVTADGYQLALPPCDGTQRIREGSRITVRGLAYFKKSACQFSTRESFEAAMQKFAEDPIRWTRYKRVKG